MAFLDYIMEAANALAQEMMSLTLDFFTNLVQWCASASYSFWDASLVNVLLQAGAGVSILVWAVSLIIVIQDVLEAISEEKRVYLGSVIGDSLKAVVFSQASPFLGILVIKFLFQIMALLNWSDSLVASWTDLVAETAGFSRIMGILITVIASGYFFYASIKNSGLFFVKVIGIINYFGPNGEIADTQAFTDAEKYLSAIEKAFDHYGINGWKYATQTNDLDVNYKVYALVADEYEYLPPHIKSEVDDLLRTVIDTEPTCRSLQEQYAQSCRDLILTYARKSEVVSRKMGEWEERFWHPHKADDKTRHNMIIKAASELTPYLTQEDVSPPNIEDAAAQTPDAETAYNQCQHKIVRSARATLFNKNASDSDRTHSLNTLQSAADNGDKYAAYQLGKAYQTGTFVEKDLIYAHQYLQAAMTEKSDWVAYSIGKLFKDEDFDDYDRAKAIQYFELADKMGSETASYQLGKAYLEGDSLQQDYWKAIKMFEKTDGFLKSAAIYSLGKIYADAKFEGHSKDKAIQYLEQAQKMGNEAAFYQLGKVYLSGEPSQQDYQKAIQMFEQAEGVLEPWAVYALGKIYLDENFNEHSRDKAIQCFEHAQELGNETAVYQLGKIYSSGEASQEDYLKAIQLLEQTKGVLKPWAEYKIGTIYQDERFSQKDLRLAVYHFQKAAGLGNEFAQYKLAKAYLQGDGVEPSTGKAIQLFEKLMQTKSEIAKAAQLNIWSEYYLGKIYLYGLGIQSNPGKGKELLQHAAENNCEPAQKLLERYNLYRAKSAMQTVKSLIMRIANSLQADTTQAKNYRPTTKTRYEHLRQAEKHQDQRTEEMYY